MTSRHLDNQPGFTPYNSHRIYEENYKRKIFRKIQNDEENQQQVEIINEIHMQHKKQQQQQHLEPFGKANMLHYEENILP